MSSLAVDFNDIDRFGRSRSDREYNATRLIDKLSIGGQLRAGFLVRVLQQGQIDLFDLGFARLLDLDMTDFRRVFYGSGACPVALACRAVGIDRAVFPTIYALSRSARGQIASLSPDERADVDEAFETFSRAEALECVRLRPFF